MLARRRLTVLIIPEEGGRTFEYKIPRLLLWFAATVGLVVVVLLAVGGRAWTEARRLTHQVERLERDKNILVEQVAQIEDLEVVLRQLESRSRQLRSITAEAVGLIGGSRDLPIGRARDPVITITERLRQGNLGTVPTMAPVPFARWRPFGQGVLFPARRGSLVRATASGRVVRTGYDAATGHALTLDHGNGLESRYGGIGTLIAEPGRYLQKGQPLGLSGQPRDGTTPGVRYALLENGRERTARFADLWQ